MIKHMYAYCLLFSIVLCSLFQCNALAATTTPFIGADDANTTADYDATMAEAGKPLSWEMYYVADQDQSIYPSVIDQLAVPSRGITTIVISLAINTNLAGILNGSRDTNLTKVAQAMASWQKTYPAVRLMVRPLAEMNGNWETYGFGGGNTGGNQVSQFNPAWDHVRSVMRAQFPTLPFMWCPNVQASTAFASFYPGNSETEYLCLDGYNFSSMYNTWQTIDQVFGPSIKAIRATPAIASGKLIVIGETGTTEPSAAMLKAGHTKAQWFTNMGSWLNNTAPGYGISAVLYFNKNWSTSTKLEDFLIYDPALSSGASSEAAFRAAIKNIR